jgi:hypothetical protein
MDNSADADVAFDGSLWHPSHCTVDPVIDHHRLLTHSDVQPGPLPCTQEEHVESLEQDMEQELQRMALSLELKRIRYLIKLYYR